MPQVMMKESLIRLLCELRDFFEILTGLPQVNWTLKDLLQPWLDCPRLIEGWHVMPLVDRRLVVWKCRPFEVIFVHWESFCFSEHSLYEFLRCQTNSQMRTMIFKQCKVYVCLEVLKKMRFLAESFLYDRSTQDLEQSLTGVRIPFVTVCFRTNPCFN